MVQSGTVGQSVKRMGSNDKAADFHSSAGRNMGRTTGKVIAGVQELEGISVTDEEQNRLYNEQYGSENSQEDGDR